MRFWIVSVQLNHKFLTVKLYFFTVKLYTIYVLVIRKGATKRREGFGFFFFLLGKIN